MELYTKVNVCCIPNITCYPDLTVKQVCYNSRTREVEIYRSAPDVEDGYCYLQLSNFSFDFRDLLAVMSKMESLGDNEYTLIPVSVKQTKRLVFQFNEEFGHWELGFQKKNDGSEEKSYCRGFGR